MEPKHRRTAEPPLCEYAEPRTGIPCGNFARSTRDMLVFGTMRLERLEVCNVHMARRVTGVAR